MTELTKRNRVVAVLVLLFVAVVGGLVGVAVDRICLLPGMFGGPPPGRHGGPPPNGHDPRHRLGRELDLTQQQEARVDSIMDRQLQDVRRVRAEAQPSLNSILERTRHEIDAVLTPEQRKKADAMRRLHPPPPPDADRFGPPGAGGAPEGPPPR